MGYTKYNEDDLEIALQRTISNQLPYVSPEKDTCRVRDDVRYVPPIYIVQGGVPIGHKPEKAEKSKKKETKKAKKKAKKKVRSLPNTDIR